MNTDNSNRMRRTKLKRECKLEWNLLPSEDCCSFRENIRSQTHHIFAEPDHHNNAHYGRDHHDSRLDGDGAEPKNT